jgi:hypothetical protein
VTVLSVVWWGCVHIEVPQSADLERPFVVIGDDSCRCSCSSEGSKNEDKKMH